MRSVQRRRVKTLNEVNITNLVDVIMVLLIIFILIAPLIKEGIKIEIPETSKSSPLSQEESILIRINKEGKFYLDNKRVGEPSLVERVKALKQQYPKNMVLIEADKGLVYGKVVGVMDKLRSAGIEEVGLVTEKLPGGTP
jgi:biopolymer transport protein TolR